MANAGSWFGLPDFGITEKLGGLLSGGKTTDLSQAISGNYGSNAQVLGTSTSDPYAGTQSTQGLVQYGPTYYGPQNTLSGGGSGSSGSNQTNLVNSAQQSSDAELASLNTAYDRNKSQLEGQLGDLNRQYQTTQDFYEQQQNLLSGQVDTSKKQAQDTAETNRADALQTAQDVQRQNRNMLRALGILTSTAGAELLNKPLGEYERVRGQIATNLSNRLNELNDFMNAKTAELTNAAAQARNQYDSLVGRIQNDLRFNERERSDAVRQASAALQDRINEIRLTLAGYTNQVANDQNTIAGYIQSLQNSNIGNVSTGAISDATLNVGQTNQNPVTASIYSPDEKRRLSSLSLAA